MFHGISWLTVVTILLTPLSALLVQVVSVIASKQRVGNLVLEGISTTTRVLRQNYVRGLSIFRQRRQRHIGGYAIVGGGRSLISHPDTTGLVIDTSDIV